jgi:hypothetical protein
MKMTDFWDIGPCSLNEVAVPVFLMCVLPPSSGRLHGVIYQKAVIFTNMFAYRSNKPRLQTKLCHLRLKVGKILSFGRYEYGCLQYITRCSLVVTGSIPTGLHGAKSRRQPLYSKSVMTLNFVLYCCFHCFDRWLRWP